MKRALEDDPKLILEDTIVLVDASDKGLDLYYFIALAEELVEICGGKEKEDTRTQKDLVGDKKKPKRILAIAVVDSSDDMSRSKECLLEVGCDRTVGELAAIPVFMLPNSVITDVLLKEGGKLEVNAFRDRPKSLSEIATSGASLRLSRSTLPQLKQLGMANNKNAVTCQFSNILSALQGEWLLTYNDKEQQRVHVQGTQVTGRLDCAEENMLSDANTVASSTNGSYPRKNLFDKSQSTGATPTLKTWWQSSGTKPHHIDITVPPGWSELKIYHTGAQ